MRFEYEKYEIIKYNEKTMSIIFNRDNDLLPHHDPCDDVPMLGPIKRGKDLLGSRSGPPTITVQVARASRRA